MGTLDSRGREMRREVLRIVESVRGGHVASAFSILEVVRVLYDSVLRHDPLNPRDPDRDRFILSKGHGCLGLYVVLAEKGYFPREELLRVGRFDSILGGHPELEKVPGVEASTGSLGHGLPIGVGIALSARLDGRSFRTYVMVGDGECNEGSVWEAAMSAAKHRLGSLTVIVDYNKMQSYSTTAEVLDLEPLGDKWRSFGFEVVEVDGHDIGLIERALRAPSSGRPRALICHTVKGKGVPFMENNAAWHHKSGVSEDDMRRLWEALETEDREKDLSQSGV